MQCPKQGGELGSSSPCCTPAARPCRWGCSSVQGGDSSQCHLVVFFLKITGGETWKDCHFPVWFPDRLVNSSYGKWLRNCNRYWSKLRDNLKKPSFLYPCMLLCLCLDSGIRERLKESEIPHLIFCTALWSLHTLPFCPHLDFFLGIRKKHSRKKKVWVLPVFPLLENFSAFILPDVANSKKSSILLLLFLPLPHTHSAKGSCKISLLYLTGICFNFHSLGVIFGNIRMSHINNLLNQNINCPQSLWDVL